MAQRDNKVNISVARDSRWIASVSRRDSSAMKTIAVLTLIFLPGTVIASIFSSNMFDFRSADGPVVSSKFWVYWAVTLPLTVGVLLVWIVWYYWSSAKQKKQDRDLEESMGALEWRQSKKEDEEEEEKEEEGQSESGSVREGSMR
ncbi:hypothetical protein GP486_004982 [Trichoglossum hirsutum]|uniref:Uncharacterized protein n=1 Tax=Trichoglossum hirsutum TaxID=265104 RepID=A0A9P8RN28_9PEZI|nr:hypothetical protein GP486_004982 [Trichoglossum hirsutum]